MTKDVRAKAILLDMQEKMQQLNKRIEACTDMREMAALFNEMAPIILSTADMIDELEAEDE